MRQYLKWVLPAVQAMITAVLLFMLVSSKILPAKYMGIVAVAALALLAVTVLLARSRNAAVSSVGSIVAIFMSGMLVFGIVYVQHILRTLDQIAGADTQIETIAVAVQDSNAAQAAGDTAGYVFGVYEGADKELLDSAESEILAENGDAELNKVVFDSPVEMAQKLLEEGDGSSLQYFDQWN